jgi:hypothetical protein
VQQEKIPSERESGGDGMRAAHVPPHEASGDAPGPIGAVAARRADETDSLGVLAKVADFFILKREESVAAAVDAERRARAERILLIARQKVRAALALRSSGHLSEALELAKQAAGAMLDQAVLLGVDPAARVDPTAVSEALACAARPVLEQDVRAEHRAALRGLLAACDALLDALRPFSRTALERRRERVLRLGAAAALATAATLGGYRLLRPAPLVAVASASHGQRYGPERAVDGDRATEWLLPNSAAGWIDVSPRKPRRCRALGLLNASNRPGPDRAVVDYRVEVFVGGQSARTIDGSFGEFVPAPGWRSIPLGVEGPVDRVRIHVLSWAGNGGGLAEIRLE